MLPNLRIKLNGSSHVSLICSLLLKDLSFNFYLLLVQLLVVPYGACKSSSSNSPIVQIIFFFWSFDISEGILRNLKIMIGLDTSSNQDFKKYIGPHLVNTSLCIDYAVERCKITVIIFGSVLPNLKGH